MVIGKMQCRESDTRQEVAVSPGAKLSMAADGSRTSL